MYNEENEGGIDLEEDKEILYLLDIAINSYIENDILRLDVSDTTKID